VHVTPGRAAAARPGLFPGATVADLVAALASGGRPLGAGDRPARGAQDTARGAGPDQHVPPARPFPDATGARESWAGHRPGNAERAAGTGQRARGRLGDGMPRPRADASTCASVLADGRAPASDRRPQRIPGVTRSRPGPATGVGPGPVRPVRARPPIGDEESLFGLSRRSRSRLGSRVFTLFFTLVFGLIFVQMIFSILYP
jgi:hypothetical protein